MDFDYRNRYISSVYNNFQMMRKNVFKKAMLPNFKRLNVLYISWILDPPLCDNAVNRHKNADIVFPCVYTANFIHSFPADINLNMWRRRFYIRFIHRLNSSHSVIIIILNEGANRS